MYAYICINHTNFIIVIKFIYKCKEDIYYIYIFIWWSPFIPSRNLDEVFTYNHIWL